jgi:hypothetical protein
VVELGELFAQEPASDAGEAGVFALEVLADHGQGGIDLAVEPMASIGRV